ncbi:antibiotic synthesis protein MbtH [Streptomyces sp. NRRL WC-3618]|uniref:MbtH family protein n=1 Tax=Streptomyces sp. NRRL WC-3618 TaxID=1519490 RepID=UPI0006AD8BA9|nr:MbtH family protein [Streptomyces sp. NRRL WC-3618]KOV71752.1 antibiotic synthesis protein MbtH [Streptomyces sp. NRRL WC-3618]
MPPSPSVPDASHLVVVNAEEQYSIWPGRRPLPDGWRAEGGPGTEAECLDRIARAWTDTRPLSARTFTGTAR